MILYEERQAIVNYGKKLLSTGLVKGTGGNISLCNSDKTLLAITPTGVPYTDMRVEDVVVLNVSGDREDGALKPSSEVAFHLSLVNLRPDIRAVVHTHSTYSTTLACLGWELPAVHYLVGHAGSHVPIAPYATYGTQQLSDHIRTIGQGNAVLMANHGLVAVGTNLPNAFTTAEMVEFVAQVYLGTKAVGDPVILGETEMEKVVSKFATYGQQP